MSGPAGGTPYMATKYSPAGTHTRGTVNNCNRGALPLRLAAAPVLAGPAATQFVIASTACGAGAILAAQQSCLMEIAFTPQGEPGLRAAMVFVAHDWIGRCQHRPHWPGHQP